MNLNTKLPWKNYAFSIVVVVIILFFWFFIYVTGQPTPFIDDIFYAGAATNFAKYGVMHNPQVRLTWPNLTTFNIYPPIQPFALGYWLALWGISTNAILLFFMTCYITASLAALMLIRYFRLHWSNIIIAVLIIANTVLFRRGSGRRCRPPRLTTSSFRSLRGAHASSSSPGNRPDHSSR